MKIETKYEIGQKVWIVCKHDGEVCLYDDIISWITVEKDTIYYGLEFCGDDIKEDEVILYEQEDLLLNRIKELLGIWEVNNAKENN